MNTPDEVAMTQEHTAIEVEATLTPAAKWECFCCPASYDMWRVRKIGERRYGQGFLVVNKESAEGLRDYLNALSTPPTTEPQPARAGGLVEALERNSGPLADAARRIAMRLSHTDNGQASAYAFAKADMLAAFTPPEQDRSTSEGEGA